MKKYIILGTFIQSLLLSTFVTSAQVQISATGVSGGTVNGSYSGGVPISIGAGYEKAQKESNIKTLSDGVWNFVDLRIMYFQIMSRNEAISKYIYGSFPQASSVSQGNSTAQPIGQVIQVGFQQPQINVSEYADRFAYDATYDLDGNGIINQSDLKVVRQKMGTSQFDFNGDGAMNMRDLNTLQFAVVGSSVYDYSDLKYMYDLDNNGVVDIRDVALYRRNAGTWQYDLNNDNQVDETDYKMASLASSLARKYGFYLTAYDLNTDGAINDYDTLLVKRYMSPAKKVIPICNSEQTLLEGVCVNNPPVKTTVSVQNTVSVGEGVGGNKSAQSSATGIGSSAVSTTPTIEVSLGTLKIANNQKVSLTSGTGKITVICRNKTTGSIISTASPAFSVPVGTSNAYGIKCVEDGTLKTLPPTDTDNNLDKDALYFVLSFPQTSSPTYSPPSYKSSNYYNNSN